MLSNEVRWNRHQDLMNGSHDRSRYGISIPASGNFLWPLFLTNLSLIPAWRFEASSTIRCPKSFVRFRPALDAIASFTSSFQSYSATWYTSSNLSHPSAICLASCFFDLKLYTVSDPQRVLLGACLPLPCLNFACLVSQGQCVPT